MTIPTRLTFHGLDPSDAAAQRVHEHVDKLARHRADITRCDVTIERHGRPFHVRIELAVPGRVLVVSHDPGDAADHEDVYVAIRDAFGAARRQLDAQHR